MQWEIIDLHTAQTVATDRSSFSCEDSDTYVEGFPAAGVNHDPLVLKSDQEIEETLLQNISYRVAVPLCNIFTDLPSHLYASAQTMVTMNLPMQAVEKYVACHILEPRSDIYSIKVEAIIDFETLTCLTPNTFGAVYERLSGKKPDTGCLVKLGFQPGVASEIGAVAVAAPMVTSGERFAVIIGISKYKDTRIPGLRYAAADAKAIYEWAVSPAGGRFAPANVQLIIDEQATNANIKTALFSWLKKAIKEDMVVIYFAGHGSPESPDDNKNLYLFPYDVDYDNIATTGFPMWDIETALQRFIKAQKVVIIADACHSGGIGESYEIARRSNRGIKIVSIQDGLEKLANIGDGICVLSAADINQLSQEGEQWDGHGVFTYYLLRGLTGEADYSKDKQVTLGELIPFVSETVRRATKNAQCPTVTGKFDPAISLGR